MSTIIRPRESEGNSFGRLTIDIETGMVFLLVLPSHSLIDLK